MIFLVEKRKGVNMPASEKVVMVISISLMNKSLDVAQIGFVVSQPIT
jgi:hypothetical protein